MAKFRVDTIEDVTEFFSSYYPLSRGERGNFRNGLELLKLEC